MEDGRYRVALSLKATVPVRDPQLQRDRLWMFLPSDSAPDVSPVSVGPDGCAIDVVVTLSAFSAGDAFQTISTALNQVGERLRTEGGRGALDTRDFLRRATIEHLED